MIKVIKKIANVGLIRKQSDNMFNKKGFTLVELLVVIVLIGLLIGIGVPGVMKIIARMKERSYKTKVSLIEQAGTLWGQDNKTRLQSHKCDIDGNKDTGENGKELGCYIININELISGDYLEADSDNLEVVGGKNIYEYIDPITNDNISDKCVWVYKKNNRVYSYYGKDCNGCISEECIKNKE